MSEDEFQITEANTTFRLNICMSRRPLVSMSRLPILSGYIYATAPFCTLKFQACFPRSCIEGSMQGCSENPWRILGRLLARV